MFLRELFLFQQCRYKNRIGQSCLIVIFTSLSGEQGHARGGRGGRRACPRSPDKRVKII